MTDAEKANVEKGQTWRDNDGRLKGRRFLEVLRVDEPFAYCRSFLREFSEDRTLRKETRIHLSRFRSTATGYVLVSEAADRGAEAERIEDTGPTAPRVDPEKVADALGAEPCSERDTIPTNVGKPPIRVKHSKLKRWSEDSPFKSICPACPDGILLMRRKQTPPHELEETDYCVGCGQAVIYEDIARFRIAQKEE